MSNQLIFCLPGYGYSAQRIICKMLLTFRIFLAQRSKRSSLFRNRHQLFPKGMPILPEPVERLLQQFRIPNSKLEEIRDAMAKEFTLGLNIGSPPSSVLMLPTYIPALPDGTERGRYLSLDLSGRNLRIMLLDLSDRDSEPHVASQNYILHESVMKGSGDRLFNFIASKLKKFLDEFNLVDGDLSLGFVFSYPVEMKSINSAHLLWWTKGFNVPDCLNQDVGRLLREALEKQGITNVKVKAIMNDTVGQLSAASYKHGHDCKISVVIGYGCNAAYLEEVVNVKKLRPDRVAYKFPKIVIDTEWQEFGSHGELNSIMTVFDREIDENSVHEGRQMVDKLTGAFFLGELVRRILDQLAVDNVLFGGTRPESLTSVDAFPAKYISEILCNGDPRVPFTNIRRILEELSVSVHGATDYAIIWEICHTISLRSAGIVAAAIAALMTVLNQPKILVDVGGALIQYHPTYHQMLKEKLKELLPPVVKEWDIVTTEDGSGKGAALIAAIAQRLQL